MRDHLLLEFVAERAWALEPSCHRRMLEVLNRHADGVKLSATEITAAIGDKPAKPSPLDMQVRDGVAVIPIRGVLSKRASMMADISPGRATSMQSIGANLRAALDNPDVASILLEIDSPGGAVDGLEEMAATIHAARGQKPIVAHTDGMMASAAYWLGSQANQVLATRGAEVGSIGILSSWMDTSRAVRNAGIDPIVVKSTPAKGGMQSTGATGDADIRDEQAMVNAFHEMFVQAVARGRGVSLQQAKALGDGRTYLGDQAKARGLVDAVCSFDQAMAAARSAGAAAAPGRMARAAAPARPHAPAASARDKDLAAGEALLARLRAAPSAQDLTSASQRPAAAELPAPPAKQAPTMNATMTLPTTSTKLEAALRDPDSAVGKQLRADSGQLAQISIELWAEMPAAARAEYGSDFVAFHSYMVALSRGAVAPIGRQ